MTVFYAALYTETMNHQAVNSLIGIAECVGNSALRLWADPDRTDNARNHFVAKFIEMATSDNDVLIMLDADQVHPADTLFRLVAWNVDVVGALYFKRRAPYEPVFYNREDGVLKPPTHWKFGLLPCAVVGTGAIAIRRRVFDKLKTAGFEFPWFRYVYADRSTAFDSEDMYFGKCCEQAGIQHHVDTSFVSEHLMTVKVNQSVRDTERMKAKKH